MLDLIKQKFGPVRDCGLNNGTSDVEPNRRDLVSGLPSERRTRPRCLETTAVKLERDRMLIG